MKNRFLVILFSATTLAGCIPGPEGRLELAGRIAAPAHLAPRVVRAGIFDLYARARITNPAAPVHVYIEGDGLAWLGRHEKSLNPTPTDPVALKLAAADDAPNVVWLARPCQYTGWHGKGPCPDSYWTSARSAPEVIAAYQAALDSVGVTGGLHLTGYSGGAAVALLAAAGRDDVLSIRTVAGNTDYAAFTALHRTTPLASSIAPEGIAGKLAHVPQMHFIGGKDDVVPRGIFDAWKKASGDDACVKYFTVADASHEKGWVEAWVKLLQQQPSCE